MVVEHDLNLFQLGFKAAAVALERLHHGIIIVIDARNTKEFSHDFTNGLLFNNTSLLTAFTVHYQPRNDLAILRVPGLGTEPLALDPDPRSGTAAAIAGFPGGGPFTLEAARLGTTGKVMSQDSYGRGPIERRMTSFRGKVRQGNSGGPVIDGDGEVLTTVFASALGEGPSQGLGVPNSVTRKALGRLGQERVDTGPCA